MGPRKRRFALDIRASDAPFLFKPGKGAQWASASAELLASLAVLHLFGWSAPSPSRTFIPVSLTAGTDYQSNDALSKKIATTRWPLMLINMQLSVLLSAVRLQLNLV